MKNFCFIFQIAVSLHSYLVNAQYTQVNNGFPGPMQYVAQNAPQTWGDEEDDNNSGMDSGNAQMGAMPSFGAQPNYAQQLGSPSSSFGLGNQFPGLGQPVNFGGFGQGNGPLTGLKYLQDLYNQIFHPESARSTPPQTSVPDLSYIISKCHKNAFFYNMNPQHSEAVRSLKEIIMSYNTTAERISASNSIRQNPDINPKMWYYALTGCSVCEPDLQGIARPSPLEVMPDSFINSEVLDRAFGRQPRNLQQAGPGAAGQSPSPQQQPFSQQQFPGIPFQGYNQPMQFSGVQNMPFQQRQGGSYSRKKRQAGSCVQLDGSVGADNGIENALWYFREDIQVNSHHWYWHLTYGVNARTHADRRGELFYYMHCSVLARYNAERLSNGLPRVVAFEPAAGANIAEGYSPHLSDLSSGSAWSTRQANQLFTNILHQNDPNLGMNVLVNNQISAPYSRLLADINQGIVRTTNGIINIANTAGIDILGDILEASRWSVNPSYYGGNSATGVHNNGHVVMAFAMDPNYQSRAPPGVMADTSTAMRDIIFYRWHTYINSIFDTHKLLLNPYAPTSGDFPLVWAGVQIASLSVQSFTGGPTNSLQTFWNNIQIPLVRGLDFARNSRSTPVNVCATILDNRPFSYKIVVNKANNVPTTRATVRIFMAPRNDEQGNRFSMLAQRSMFFVLDTFTTTLNAGSNTIFRNSTQNALTVPWPQTLQEQNNDPNMQTTYCGCGWPQHMLLPKGTPNGMVFDLFVMITNGDQDAVSQQGTRPTNCITAPLFCGIPNGRYPDARPMGYPFDRAPYSVNGAVVPNLDAYLAAIPNAASIPVVITSQS